MWVILGSFYSSCLPHMMPLSASQEKSVLFLLITMLMKKYFSTKQSFRSAQTQSRAAVHVWAGMHQSVKTQQRKLYSQTHRAAGTTNYGSCFILTSAASVYLAGGCLKLLLPQVGRSLWHTLYTLSHTENQLGCKTPLRLLSPTFEWSPPRWPDHAPCPVLPQTPPIHSTV